MTFITPPDAPDDACSELVTSIYQAIDSGRATTAAVYYTEDAVLEAARGTAQGAAAITAMFASREANSARVTRHVLSDIRVTDVVGSKARLDATLTIYALSGPHPDKPEGVSDLLVELTHDARGWRVHHQRSTRRAGSRP